MINKEIEKITSTILRKQEITQPKKINPTLIAKNMGIDVQSEELSSEVSGLFIMKEGKPFIRYNKEESSNRQRFSIAHELGHFVLHKDKKPLFINKQKLYRDSNSTTGEIRIEREANAFAASLLMPKEFIKEEINNAPDDIEGAIKYLAKVFKVSEQAMNYRLINLGYYSSL